MPSYSKVVISSLAYELAPVVVSSEELEERLEPMYRKFHFSEGQLEELTGIQERRWWEPGTRLSDPAIAAARKAQAAYGTDVGIAAVEAIPSDGQRRGTVYLGIVIGNTEFTELVALPGDRARLRNYAVIGLMNYVRKLLS